MSPFSTCPNINISRSIFDIQSLELGNFAAERTFFDTGANVLESSDQIGLNRDRAS